MSAPKKNQNARKYAQTANLQARIPLELKMRCVAAAGSGKLTEFIISALAEKLEK